MQTAANISFNVFGIGKSQCCAERPATNFDLVQDGVKCSRRGEMPERKAVNRRITDQPPVATLRNPMGQSTTVLIVISSSASIRRTRDPQQCQNRRPGLLHFCKW